MFETKTYGDITQFRMGTNYFGRTFYQVCCYLVDGLMIDTGCYGCSQEFIAACEQAKVNQAVITHHHEDHAGNGWYFAQRGMPVWSHRDTEGLLVKGLQEMPLYRQLVWRKPPVFQVNVVSKKIETEHYTFKIINTPGHSVDHICIYEEKQGWLFTGDLFLGEKVRIGGSQENYSQIINSLRRVKQLDVSIIFCSLGRVIKNPYQALEAKIQFMEEIQEKIWRINQQGYNIKEITKQVLGSDWPLKLISCGDFCKENLVRSVLLKKSQ